MDINYFSIPNYTMVNQNRRLSTHGGLITYIHNDYIVLHCTSIYVYFRLVVHIKKTS